MAALVHCLLRSCFEEENDDDEPTHETNASYEPPRPSARMVRYESTSQGEEEDDESDDCCQPENDNNGLRVFWRRLKDRWKTYESLEPHDVDERTLSASPDEDDVPFQRSAAPFGIFRRTNSSGSKSENEPPLLLLSQSPLKTASSFRDSKHAPGIPSIEPEEVVLPGSALQREMAAAVSLEEQGDECVICMEGFDPTNPRMPTLCGCGENKTYFHLPCLYQWIEQSNECPSCRKRLRWEEF